MSLPTIDESLWDNASYIFCLSVIDKWALLLGFMCQHESLLLFNNILNRTWQYREKQYYLDRSGDIPLYFLLACNDLIFCGLWPSPCREQKTCYILLLNSSCHWIPLADVPIPNYTFSGAQSFGAWLFLLLTHHILSSPRDLSLLTCF